MIPQKIKKYLFSFIFICLLALAPNIARADAEGVVRYGVTAADLQTDFFDGYGRDGYIPVRLTGYLSGRFRSLLYSLGTEYQQQTMVCLFW